jgi:hypothetical protein
VRFLVLFDAELRSKYINWVMPRDLFRGYVGALVVMVAGALLAHYSPIHFCLDR